MLNFSKANALVFGSNLKSLPLKMISTALFVPTCAVHTTSGQGPPHHDPSVMALGMGGQSLITTGPMPGPYLLANPVLPHRGLIPHLLPQANLQLVVR